MKLKKEERILTTNSPDLKIRALEEGGKRYFTGYAAVFNSKSRLLAEGGRVFYEFIERGAFDEALQREDLDVKLTFNHNKQQIMGRTKSGTLTVNADETGLFFRGEVPNTTLGNDTWEMVQRGDYPDCSFVFTIKDNRWERDSDGTPIHIVERVAGLYDVAICVDGAYESTSVSAELSRAVEEMAEEEVKEEEETQTEEKEETWKTEYELDEMILHITKLKSISKTTFS